MRFLRILYANDCTSAYDEMFVRYLLGRGHEVHIFTLLDESTYDMRQRFHLEQYKRLSTLPRVVLHKKPYGHRNPPLIVTLLKNVIRKVKPKVLVGNYLQSYAFYSALSTYHPFVAIVWGSDVLIHPWVSRIGRIRAKFALASADFVIVDSGIQKQAAIALGCTPNRIESFPWCVDLKRFNPSVDGARLRAKLGFADDDFVVICNRDHEERYGLEYFVRSIPIVLARIPNAKFLVLGEGKLTQDLRILTEALGVTRFAHFTGNVLHSKMPSYLSASDVYVSPSLSDGTSSSLLEAMACEKAVIVTDIPGNREWISERKNGLLVRPKSPEKIADAIVTLRLNPNLAARYAKEALETARRKADLSVSLERYEEVLVTASAQRAVNLAYKIPQQLLRGMS